MNFVALCRVTLECSTIFAAVTATDKRHIAILGSTGSIGTQALEVIAANPSLFQVEVLTAFSKSDLLIQQALKFKPNAVVIVDESKYEEVKDALWDEGVKVYAGADALAQVVQMEEIHMVLTALVGFSGLKPTVAAIKAGKHIALANKETLVVAGELITQLAYDNKVLILPVDSEHSAIFQCLIGEQGNPVEKLILTCSGGPFRGKTSDFLRNVTAQQALKHPNWEMGAKITVDSASLMNKGLEVIEAKWLFNVDKENIEVIVHPQSIIHSIAQFTDGSMKAQMGLPDMKLPIQYALAFPQRISSDFPRFNFLDYPSLTFEQPDSQTFRNLALAYSALGNGGSQPCVLNAANEITNRAFLEGRLGFLEMAEVNEMCLAKMPMVTKPSLEDYFEVDRETRILAKEIIN